MMESLRAKRFAKLSDRFPDDGEEVDVALLYTGIVFERLEFANSFVLLEAYTPPKDDEDDLSPASSCDVEVIRLRRVESDSCCWCCCCEVRALPTHS